jgi:hypothetical protein
MKHTPLHEEVQKAMHDFQIKENLDKKRKHQYVKLIDLSKNIVSGWDELTDEQKGIIQDMINQFITENERNTQSDK